MSVISIVERLVSLGISTQEDGSTVHGCVVASRLVCERGAALSPSERNGSDSCVDSIESCLKALLKILRDAPVEAIPAIVGAVEKWPHQKVQEKVFQELFQDERTREVRWVLLRAFITHLF